MSANRRTNNGGRKAHVRNIYVARTVEDGQPQLGSFLNTTGRRLGRSATIRTLGSTHVTFLSTGNGMRQVFRAHGLQPQDVRRFSGDLQQFIDDEMPVQERRVPLDPDRPLIWVGGRACKLALNLELTPGLQEQRELIEEFLAQHFDKVPPLQGFDPHITIGHVHSRIAAQHYAHPEQLVAWSDATPATVALNGLMTYLDNIGQEEQYVTSAAG